MINLGDEVKDLVTGLKGIAIARHTYLQGCDRISVQPQVGKNQSFQELQTFDEPQLVVIKVGKVKRKAVEKDPGGPAKYMDRGRVTG